MTVQEIFADRGEKAFPDMESEKAHKLGEREEMVVSTGGRMLHNTGNVSP